MSGKELYELWVAKLAAQVDRSGKPASSPPPAWPFLTYEQRTAWTDTAREVVR